MKKRITALLLAIMMTSVFVLTACSGNNEMTDNTQPTATQASDETTAGEENKPTESADPFGKYDPGITLRGAWVDTGGTVFVPGNPDYDSASQNVYIDAYKERLGISVEYDWVSADMDAYNTKWNLATAQQNLPDFGMVNEVQYKMLLEAGLIMDMTDIFEQYASDKYKAFLDADGGATRGYSTHEGRLMGLPITGATPDSVALIHIRKDWLDKLDLPVPTTIDELDATMQAFIDNKMGGEGTFGLIGSKQAFGADPDVAFRGIMNGYGAYPNVWIPDESGKLHYGSASEKTYEPLLKLQEWYKKGFINKDFAVTEKSIAKEDVAAGKVGVVFGTFYLASGVGDNAIADPNAEWVIADIPTIDGSKPIAQSSVSRTQFIFVNKDCKNPEAVVKLINLEIDLIFNEDSDVVLKYTTHPSPVSENENIQTSKYVATVQFCGMPWQNLTRHTESVAALESGKEDFSIALSKTTYDNHLRYEGGERSLFNSYHIFGPAGTFTVINQLKNEDRILLDHYQSIPTTTMTEKKSILDDALYASMINVVMGEDISTYEKAVADWFKNGGQEMTDEVNAWYETR